MAQPTQKTVEIEELLRLSEQCRIQLGHAHANLRHTLDMPTRVKESIMSQPAKWLGGGLATGLVASFLFRPKRKPPEALKTVKRQRGMLLGALGLAITLLKPAAKVYATKLLKDYLRNHFREGALRRPPLGKPSRY